MKMNIKKIILLFSVMLMMGSTFAQMKRDRTTAYNYWMKKNYEKAKEFIDKATEYPEANGDAKVWYYKGGIYLDVYNSPKGNDIAPNALEVAYNALIKSRELDTKNEYRDDIDARMSGIAGEYFNSGLELFKIDRYSDAAPLFEKAIALNKAGNITDTMSYLAAGLCYKALAHKDAQYLNKAIENYSYLISINTNKPEVYTDLTDVYLFDKKYDKALEVIKSAKERYPNNPTIIIAEANVYLQSGDFAKAVEQLKLAAKNEPNNVLVHFALGSSYESMAQNKDLKPEEVDQLMEEAIASYKKSLELKEDFYEPMYSLGVLYYNKGVEVVNKANQLPINEVDKYNTMIEQGNDIFKNAMPYLEKCHELQPNDADAKTALREIYTRLKMFDKAKALTD